MGRRPGPSDSAGRERLLDAAVSLFAKRGIANTTIAQIAAEAEVTGAMVHYWFETREKLQDAIVDERIAPLMRGVWITADPEQGDVGGLVRGLVLRMLDATERAPWLPSLWLREIVQEGGLLKERMLKRIPLEQAVAFRRNVARAQARGGVNPDVSPDLLFISMLALVMLPQAVAGTWQRVNPEVVVDRAGLERHVLGLVMAGLAPQPKARGSRKRP